MKEARVVFVLKALSEKPMRYSELRRFYPATEAAFLKSLKKLLEYRLIIKDGELYKITEKGSDYLKLLQQCTELIKEFNSRWESKNVG